MWEFYLASAEAAFRYEDLVVFQIQLSKRNDVIPVTRDYIGQHETAAAQGSKADLEGAVECDTDDILVG
ncbi:cyclopropane-fatty-acyl-phospholipid synthase [Rhizobium esperanzae]|uniref:Cyclopropane-fatty-acyl-phospholipid synthase n=1 Tax=Rhizobium esperanzae TaxID=1967781 RepID=A0A7W6R6A2_9HYPH|nr:cyclopropane-fatty-acyl-phospholipid synthase [Rhizobium esperanzae]